MTNKEIDDAIELLQPVLGPMFAEGDDNIRNRFKFYVFGENNEFLLADSMGMTAYHLYDGTKWHVHGRWKLHSQRMT